MLRKVVSAAVIVVLCVGIALADEITGRITKVEGDKVTFTEFKGKEKGETRTLPVDAKVKVVKGKFDKDTKKITATDEAIPEGLKNKMFTEISDKGVFANIITDKDNKKITEIVIFGGRGGKKGKDK